jgi:hypothetical protein
MRYALPMKMKNSKVKIFVVLIFIVLTMILNIPTSANEGGFGDGFVNGNDCLSCHDTDQNLDLGAGHESISIGTSKPKITIQVSVGMAKISSPSETYGVMLLTPLYGNLSDDGWIILSDPKGNEVPKNYIERSRTENSLMEWQVDNKPGSYTIKVVVVYGSNSIESYEEVDVNFNIGKPDENNLPQLSSPKAILLSDEKTYDFEVTYVDLEGEYPRNITVNISGLGSFDMLPRTQTPHDFQEGVEYYFLTNLPEARYSYHFAAFDGTSWNSTENSLFYTGVDDGADVDPIPLLFGILIASVVVGAVYILRGKRP